MNDLNKLEKIEADRNKNWKKDEKYMLIFAGILLVGLAILMVL